MSTLHLLIPVFFAVQFILLLVAMASAMFFADPQLSAPSHRAWRQKKSARAIKP